MVIPRNCICVWFVPDDEREPTERTTCTPGCPAHDPAHQLREPTPTRYAETLSGRVRFP